MFKYLLDLSFTLIILKVLNLITIPWLQILIPAGLWIVFTFIELLIKAYYESKKDNDQINLEQDEDGYVNLTKTENGQQTITIKHGRLVHAFGHYWGQGKNA